MPSKAASSPRADTSAAGPPEDGAAWRRVGRGAVYVAAGGVVVLVALALAFAPVVRWVVDRRASGIGIDVEVDQVRAGLLRVHLVGVDVRPRWLSGVRVHLDQVTADLGPTLGLAGIEVHGGHVRIEASLTELRKRWEGRRSGGRTVGSGPGPKLTVDGLTVEWRNALERGAVQHAWGLSYARADDQTETVAADLLRLAAYGSGAEIGGLRVVLARRDGSRSLSKVSAQSVGAYVDVDGQLLSGLLELRGNHRGSRRGASAQAPSAVAAGSAAAVGSVQPRPPPPPGPKPRAASRAAVADVVRKPEAAGRGQRLRAGLRDVASAAAAMLVPGAKVEFSGVRAKVRKRGETLNVGPATFSVQRTGEHLDARLVPGAAPAKASVTLALHLPIDEGPVSLELAGGPVSLATLGVQEGDMGLVDVDQSRIDVRGRATLDADGAFLDASGRYRVQNLSLEHDKLASTVVRGIDIGGSGRGRLALDGTRVVVEDAELSVGRVKLGVTADITRSEGRAEGRVSVKVPLAACQDLYDSTPRALLPDLDGMRFGGHFSFSGDIRFDTDRPADIDVGWKVDSACRIEAVPARVHPDRFAAPFRLIVSDSSGEALEITRGPGTESWVPLHEISPHMETAVIVCEDARFRVHEGFDHKAIRESIKDNVKAGRFVRGASTVSMQLAKNLYLERDKTLSRKLQEAVLTALLEQELSKDQILELYLNVIEFGPGVYGVREAARHYFASDPSELTLAQSMFLASILPNPKAGHFNPDGTLGERWRAYIDRLVGIAHKISRATDEELEAALAEPLRFGEPAPNDTDDFADGVYGVFPGVGSMEGPGTAPRDSRGRGAGSGDSVGGSDSPTSRPRRFAPAERAGDEDRAPPEFAPTPGP